MHQQPETSNQQPVLMLTGEYPPRRGGVADYTARLSEALRALGHQVTVLTGAEPGGVPAEAPEARRTVADWGFGCWRTALAALDAKDPEEADQVFRKLSSVCGQFLDWCVEPEPVVTVTAWLVPVASNAHSPALKLWPPFAAHAIAGPIAVPGVPGVPGVPPFASVTDVAVPPQWIWRESMMIVLDATAATRVVTLPAEQSAHSFLSSYSW